MSIYDELGVTRVINGQFALTRLGGSTLPDEVVAAMNEANTGWAWLWDLEEQANRIISDITGAEGAHVTCGAFSGLVLCAAVAIAGKDPEKMQRLPDTTGMKNEIIIQKCIRSFMYDRSMEVPGGKLVVVGEDTSCTEAQLEAAISERTAAIHYLAGGSGPWWWAGEGGGPWPVKGVTPVPIEEVVALGKRHDIPIIVDAAGQTWPLDGLTKFVSMGCDLVVYGGKYFLGPNSTGIVIGRKDLVEAVALHSFVGYESGPGIRPGYYKGVGRGYKLDRQEIVGLVVALQKWASMDHDKERIEPAHARADYIVNALSDLPHLSTEMVPPRGEPIPYHRLSLLITLEQKTASDVAEIKRELMEGDPSIWVDARGSTLIINTLFLLDGEEKILADRLKMILTS